MKWRSLREIPTDVLQRELAQRRVCVDCRTEWSSGWHPAGEHRTRCGECEETRRVAETPLLVEADA